VHLHNNGYPQKGSNISIDKKCVYDNVRI